MLAQFLQGPPIQNHSLCGLGLALDYRDEAWPQIGQWPRSLPWVHPSLGTSFHQRPRAPCAWLQFTPGPEGGGSQVVWKACLGVWILRPASPSALHVDCACAHVAARLVSSDQCPVGSLPRHPLRGLMGVGRPTPAQQQPSKGIDRDQLLPSGLGACRIL